MTDKILPEEPNAAVEKMMSLAQECLNLVKAETLAIDKNNLAMFAVNESHKGKAFDFYTRAAGEFRERMDELQGKVNPTLITELQRIQLELQEQAERNNVQLEQIEGLKKEG